MSLFFEVIKVCKLSSPGVGELCHQTFSSLLQLLSKAVSLQSSFSVLYPHDNVQAPPTFSSFLPTQLVSFIYIYTNPLKIPPKEPHLMTNTRRYILEASSKCPSVWNQRQSQQKTKAKTVPNPYMILQQKPLFCRNSNS